MAFKDSISTPAGGNNSEQNRLLRERDIIGDPNATPPIPAIMPISRAHFWKMVQKGIYPPGIKLGPRIRAWHARDIYALMENGVQC